MMKISLKLLVVIILLAVVTGSNAAYASWGFDTTWLDPGNRGSFDWSECLGDMNGPDKYSLFGRQGYAYQSMGQAQTVRMQAPPGIKYTDYVTQQCRGQKPATVHRFMLNLINQDPFNPQYSVTLDSVSFRNGYSIPGYGQTALMFNCDIYELSFEMDFGLFSETITLGDICRAYSWYDRYTQTFDKSEIRDWTDGNAGFGSKDLMAYRVCLRSVPPGMPFNPKDPHNRDLVPDIGDVIINGEGEFFTPLGTVPSPDSSPRKLASLYSKDQNNNYINASNRTKICAYNVQIKPDCNNPATKSAFAIGTSIAGGMFGGGVVGALVGGSLGGMLCSAISGDGPCFAPQVNWSSAFIGCVDAPITPGPPILNATLPIVIKAVVDSKIAYPNPTQPSTAGEKATPEMNADQGKSPQELLQTRTQNSLKMGGTFDQPILQIVTGASTEDLFPATLSGDDTQIYNKLKLRYKFPNDTEVIDNLSSCGSINTDYLNSRFCLYYDQGTPDKICACVQNNSIYSDCYDPACTNTDRTTCPLTSQMVGCAVRPSPNQSSIQYNITQGTVQLPQVKVLTNQMGANRPLTDYPALSLKFQAVREQGTTNRVVNVAGQWIRSKDGSQADITKLESYYLPDLTNGNNKIPEFEYLGSDASGQLPNCQIAVNSDGSMVDSNYFSSSPWTSACNYTPNISRSFYGLYFQTVVPAYDDQNKVLQTQIITPTQVLTPYSTVTPDNCHKNINTCVKSYISSSNFQSCWTQDLNNLLSNNIVTYGMLMKYPVLSLPGQSISRAYNKICDSSKLNLMTQKCGRDDQGNLITGFNPSSPPTQADFNFVTSSSDSEALSAYCPGLLNEADFEDMDISRICLTYDVLKWPQVNQEISSNAYNPDFSLRTCIKSSNKVCRGYLTPKGGNIAATPSDPASNDTLPDNSKWTSWPRPPKATSPNNPVTGYCSSGYGVEQFNQLEQNPNNFISYSRHPGTFVNAGYNLMTQTAFCNQFTDLRIPTVNATLTGSCGQSQTFNISIDQLNDTTLNNDVTAFNSAHPNCTPSTDQITAFKLQAYQVGAGAFNPPLDISTYTVALQNAQNTYNSGYQVTASYNANSTLQCTSTNSNCASIVNNWNRSFSNPSDIYNPITSSAASTINMCNTSSNFVNTFTSTFTFNPATFTSSDLDNAVAAFTNTLYGSSSTSSSYSIYYSGTNTQCNCPVCSYYGFGCCYWSASSGTGYVYYNCPYDFRSSASTAIQNFRDTVTNLMSQKLSALQTAQVNYISGVSNLVQTTATALSNKCSLYYSSYSAGVNSVSQTEMCNRVTAANPTITTAQCQAIPVGKKAICSKIVNGGGISQSLCDAITDTTLKAVCNPLVSYTAATCNAISDPSNKYFDIGAALVTAKLMTQDTINKLNEYATTTDIITLADNTQITGSNGNIAAVPPATSPYASYLAQRIMTANNITLDGVTINLTPRQVTPTRTCDYSLNHRGCYVDSITHQNVCQNTCVKIPGCVGITRVSDFTGYATWAGVTPTALQQSQAKANTPTFTADVSAPGVCTIPGVTATPQRMCRVVYYNYNNTDNYYSYWLDINPNDPGTQACLAASVNYW